MKKRILSMMLALVMLLGLLPSVAAEENPGGFTSLPGVVDGVYYFSDGDTVYTCAGGKVTEVYSQETAKFHGCCTDGKLLWFVDDYWEVSRAELKTGKTDKVFTVPRLYSLAGVSSTRLFFSRYDETDYQAGSVEAFDLDGNYNDFLQEHCDAEMENGYLICTPLYTDFAPFRYKTFVAPDGTALVKESVNSSYVKDGKVFYLEKPDLNQDQIYLKSWDGKTEETLKEYTGYGEDVSLTDGVLYQREEMKTNRYFDAETEELLYETDKIMNMLKTDRITGENYIVADGCFRLLSPGEPSIYAGKIPDDAYIMEIVDGFAFYLEFDDDGTDYWKYYQIHPFRDVAENAWYSDDVHAAADRKLFGGTGAGIFEPESPMTRAMLVTVLWRYEGSPADGGDIFADVPPVGEWYSASVAWAAKNKVVGGVGGGCFDPDGNVTREQMAAILYRYAKAKGMDVTARADLSVFPDDNQVSLPWALEPMQWAVGEKLIGGSDGYLLPQGNATRAQVATIFMRFIRYIAGEEN